MKESMDGGTLSEVLFVLWGFPELTQTFIHREMVGMQRRGVRVNVLAGERIARDDLDEVLADIAARTLYLGPPHAWARRGLAWAARHPARFSRALGRMVAMGHRTQLHRMRAAAMLLAAASVVEDVRAGGYRYVHAHFASYSTELAMGIALLADLPYGVTGHATGIWKDRSALGDKIAGARAVMTCTAHNAEHLRGLAPGCEGRIHLVRHGLDLARVPAPPPYPDGVTTRWVAVGRLVPKKGFDVLLGACGRLVRAGVRFEVEVLGDGPERDALERRARGLALGPRVRFAGAVPNDRVWDAVGRAHGLVQPSVRCGDGDVDGIPNVILEAMASRRPVVGTRLSGIPEVVVDGRTGRLVEPGDPDALAHAMREVGDGRDAARAMGERGRALVEEMFDLDRNLEAQLAILAGAVG